MRPLALATIVSAMLLPAQVPAQELDETPLPDLSDQLGKALRDLTDKMKPAWEKIRDQLSILGEVDSFEHYGAPEVLPNGDIIIRRDPNAPAYTPPGADDPEAAPDGTGVAVPI